MHKLIVEGVTAIKTETNPHVLEKKLSSVLPPAARRVPGESADEMRRRYLKLARQRREAEPAPEGSPAEAAGLGAGPGVQRRR